MDTDHIARIELPGVLADFLNADGTAGAHILQTVETKPFRRGSLIVSAPLSVHEELLGLAWVLNGEGADNTKAERNAYRRYAEAVQMSKSLYSNA